MTADLNSKAALRRQRACELYITAERFNARVEVGELVIYRRDDGSTVRTRTRTKALVLGNHTVVVWLAGIVGCVALDRVTAIRDVRDVA